MIAKNQKNIRVFGKKNKKIPTYNFYSKNFSFSNSIWNILFLLVILIVNRVYILKYIVN